MILKTYHIMDKDEYMKFINHFHPVHGSHYIHLPSGKVLVAASFNSEASEEYFSTANKESLPHPIFESQTKLRDSHVSHLKHLFDSENTAKNATTKDVVDKVKLIHPLMKLSVFNV